MKTDLRARTRGGANADAGVVVVRDDAMGVVGEGWRGEDGELGDATTTLEAKRQVRALGGGLAVGVHDVEG